MFELNKTCYQVDTIAAQATPSGKGGVAIVRISGPLTQTIIAKILQCNLVARQAHRASFYDENGDIIDDGIAIYFPKPHSFTGEDVLELHAHGGPIIVDLLLECVLNINRSENIRTKSAPIRLAKPGEFTERAFLNNKIDLTQAEAIADLINASSRKSARLAMRSLQGEFASAVNVIVKELINLRVYIEAAIDFVDEEIDFLADDKIKGRLSNLLGQLSSLQKQAGQGSKLREGIKVVIIGAPNVGKSSLLNRLSAQELAIVTDIPGTTRDVLHSQIIVDGLPLHIVDTAGLRTSSDVIEQEGVRRAYAEMQTADLLLHVLDASSCKADISMISNINAQNTLTIINKIDLTGDMPGIRPYQGKEAIYISALSNLGMGELKQAVKKIAGLDDNTQGMYLARRRHLDALFRTYKHAEMSLHQLSNGPEFAAEDLRLAHRALCEITGEFSADDLLGEIFSNFCIGK